MQLNGGTVRSVNRHPASYVTLEERGNIYFGQDGGFVLLLSVLTIVLKSLGQINQTYCSFVHCPDGTIQL